MKLLNELIESLSGEQPNLTDTLMKAKVLLHRLGRKELGDWVNLELNGYPDQTAVPSYRIVPAQIMGAVTDGFTRYPDHPLPTLHLKQEIRDKFEKLEIRDSISVLEGLAKNDKNGLTRSIPLEFNGQINKALTGGFYVERAWSEMGMGRFTEVLTQVRSRLLDFLLELSEIIGEDMNDDEVKQVGQSPETATMFNHAIFGDNATILVGDHSSQTISNKIKRGDFQSLRKLLQDNQVPTENIDELFTAVKSDAAMSEVADKEFGPSVKGWIKGMVDMAIEGAWQIELGIAANLLTHALRAYYGW